MKYKARIYCDVVEDSYADGESVTVDNSWIEKLEANSKQELKNAIVAQLNVEWKDISQEDINEYSFASEYWTSYLVNEDNIQATDKEKEAWKDGKLKLWSVNCQILVSKVIETKAVL